MSVDYRVTIGTDTLQYIQVIFSFITVFSKSFVFSRCCAVWPFGGASIKMNDTILYHIENNNDVVLCALCGLRCTTPSRLFFPTSFPLRCCVAPVVGLGVLYYIGVVAWRVHRQHSIKCAATTQKNKKRDWQKAYLFLLCGVECIFQILNSFHSLSHNWKSIMKNLNLRSCLEGYRSLPFRKLRQYFRKAYMILVRVYRPKGY